MAHFTFYLIGGGIKRWCAFDVWCLTSVCLSVAYIGPKSRTERRRKAKIGTEVAHVTRDSHTTFRVKRSKVKVTRPLCSPPCWRVRQLQRWAWERVGRGKLLLRRRLLGRARRFGAHGGGEGRGVSWRPPAYSLFVFSRITRKLLYWFSQNSAEKCYMSQGTTH